MSEETTETTTDTTTEAPDVEALKADVEKWKALSRKNEEKAKANAKDVKEFEAWKASQLSETERAIEDAKAAVRAEVAAEYGAKLARTAFLSAADGRLKDAKAVLSRVDVTQFLDADGEPDTKAIGEFLDGIAPAQQEQEQTPNEGLFQGARGDQGSALPLNGDPLLQKVMGILGTR
ncbi:hypothetical protein [Streptomyces sp. Isolate_219]|uniref:hypothetical protein n=1 Tax=Streptomyces sp. Isolate_219 TaxID=2950110 RepID=UPI0021C9E990|nr:hypothetical protein [Streptomyces sp. Isolate_219]MCR8576471.1 hypothetical protein [Streptomyces sp. Isolate_219]